MGKITWRSGTSASPEILKALGLTLTEADLFGGVTAMELHTEFVKWN